jgi:hypothetical protein
MFEKNCTPSEKDMIEFIADAEVMEAINGIFRKTL